MSEESPEVKNDLIVFKAINNFINQLAEQFGKNHKPLSLYHRLVKQTPVSNTAVIHKHVNIWRQFCIANRDLILNKNYKDFKETTISYSERVFINLKYVFGLVKDHEILGTMWKHLMYIAALLDPGSRAKDILKESMRTTSIKDDSKEAEFINSIISSVENSDIDASNPMGAISSLMSSGLLGNMMGNMMGNMQNGNLDMGKLFGLVQTMIGSMETQIGDDPQAKQQMGMLNTMMASVNTTLVKNEDNGKQLDVVEQDTLKVESVKIAEIEEDTNDVVDNDA